ncbi:MAG TPA: dihydropteroate synthase [Polyangiaceae bacterium]|nr:dihydropteroate synthase [Polyangiaceae bacterium]
MGALSTQLGSDKSRRRALLMGVVNATPDSFYQAGRSENQAAALARVDQLRAEGAEIADIGGESSRPGAAAVAPDEQIARVEPAVAHAVQGGQLQVSVDTTSPRVAERMLAIGAVLVNDVSCLADPDLARVTAKAGATLILMHTRGALGSMAGFSDYPDDAYEDVVADVRREWCAARDRAVAAGLPRERVWFDPGIGFGKNARQSFELLRRLAELRDLGVPLVVGASRKSFIRAVDDAGPEERLGGTIAACLWCAAQGADVLRVHDVRAVRQALSVTEMLAPPRAPEAVHA